jgi:hypothetical protein
MVVITLKASLFLPNAVFPHSPLTYINHSKVVLSSENYHHQNCVNRTATHLEWHTGKYIGQGNTSLLYRETEKLAADMAGSIMEFLSFSIFSELQDINKTC